MLDLFDVCYNHTYFESTLTPAYVCLSHMYLASIIVHL